MDGLIERMAAVGSEDNERIDREGRRVVQPKPPLGEIVRFDSPIDTGTTVYIVVWEPGGPDYCIAAVFSTKEAAEEYIARRDKPDEFNVEDWPVDPTD